MRAARSLILAALTLVLIAAPAAAQAQSTECPCTVFAPGDAPLGDAIQDQPIEVGMKFRSDEDGFITALRFYKQRNNTGTHVGHLWSGTGQLLAEVEFTGETASGWQEEALPMAVPITRDTTYITSYHSSQGRFAFSGGYFLVAASTARRFTLCPTPSPAATAFTTTGRAPSPTRPSTPRTTGSTPCSTGCPPRTRARRE